MLAKRLSCKNGFAKGKNERTHTAAALRICTVGAAKPKLTRKC